MRLNIFQQQSPASLTQSMIRHARQPVITFRWYVHQLNRRRNTHYLVTMNHGGTHWLRMQIALYLEHLYELQDSKKDLKRFELIPPLHRKQYLFKYNNDVRIPRVQTTHAPYLQRHFRRSSVILLLRDLRDVLVSYYTTLVERSAPELTFSEFLREQNLPEQESNIYTLSSRIKFLNSWSKAKNKVRAMNIVKFESMRQNPEAELYSIIRFLDLPVSENSIKRALDGSSLKNMQKLEQNEHSFKSKKSKKVRSGSEKKYYDYFSEADRSYFQKIVNEQLIDSFGYDYNKW